jgi:hypothetical protein
MRAQITGTVGAREVCERIQYATEKWIVIRFGARDRSLESEALASQSYHGSVLSFLIERRILTRKVSAIWDFRFSRGVSQIVGLRIIMSVLSPRSAQSFASPIECDLQI